MRIDRTRAWGVVAAALVAGCPKVVKDPADKTVPTVEIKVKGADGQYAAASTASLSATGDGALDLMCIVRDPDGVRSADLFVSAKVDTCTVGSSVWGGVYYVTPIPGDENQQLSGDAQGQVLTSLPLLQTIKGPFSCDVPGQGKGVPYGTTIQVSCTGANWSSTPAHASATAKLALTLH